MAVESSKESIDTWRKVRRLAGSGLSVPELASRLADLPVSRGAQGRLGRYGDLRGVDCASCRAWAKKLSQADPDAAEYHAEGRLDEYVENVDLESAGADRRRKLDTATAAEYTGDQGVTQPKRRTPATRTFSPSHICVPGAQAPD